MRLVKRGVVSEKQVCDEMYLSIRRFLLKDHEHLWKEFTGLMIASEYTIPDMYNNFNYVIMSRIDPDFLMKNPIVVNVSI